MNHLAPRIAATALLVGVLVATAGMTASAHRPNARCVVLAIHKGYGKKVVLRDTWVVRVRIRNELHSAQRVRGIWRVAGPHHRRFRLRARLKPQEHKETRVILGRGGGRPDVDLLECHSSAGA